jgi:hypothetical protein
MQSPCQAFAPNAAAHAAYRQLAERYQRHVAQLA